MFRPLCITLLLVAAAAGRIASADAPAPLPAALLGQWEPVSQACHPAGRMTVSQDRIVFASDPEASFRFRTIRAEAGSAWLAGIDGDYGTARSSFYRLRLDAQPGRQSLELASGEKLDAGGEVVNLSRCWYVRAD